MKLPVVMTGQRVQATAAFDLSLFSSILLFGYWRSIGA
jgi:hypothetical protein